MLIDNRASTKAAGRQSGFTLIEMAVVIFIMTIILGSILVPLSSQVEQRQLLDAQRQLEEAREALIGYALAQPKPFLPCPDKTTSAGAGAAPNDGLEDRDTASGACASSEGNIPWATLGIAAIDSWGHRIRYRVSPGYANSVYPIALDEDGNIQICAATSAPLNVCDANQAITETSMAAEQLRNKPAAVLVSHGPNGWGSINPTTNAQLLPPGCGSPVGCADMGINEQANADGTELFVTRPPNSSASGALQFDDIVIWLSPHVLKQRLVAGGKLP